MRQHALIGMVGRSQDIDAVGQIDQVGETRRITRQGLRFQPFPGAVVIADDRGEMGQRREVGQQFVAANAMLFGTSPFEIDDQTMVHPRR